MASEPTSIQCEECGGVRQECDCPDPTEWPAGPPTVSEMERIVEEDDRIYAELGTSEKRGLHDAVVDGIWAKVTIPAHVTVQLTDEELRGAISRIGRGLARENPSVLMRLGRHDEGAKNG